MLLTRVSQMLRRVMIVTVAVTAYKLSKINKMTLVKTVQTMKRIRSNIVRQGKTNLKNKKSAIKTIIAFNKI